MKAIAIVVFNLLVITVFSIGVGLLTGRIAEYLHDRRQRNKRRGIRFAEAS